MNYNKAQMWNLKAYQKTQKAKNRKVKKMSVKEKTKEIHLKSKAKKMIKQQQLNMTTNFHKQVRTELQQSYWQQLGW